jgi:hypothetical protein
MTSLSPAKIAAAVPNFTVPKFTGPNFTVPNFPVWNCAASPITAPNLAASKIPAPKITAPPPPVSNPTGPALAPAMTFARQREAEARRLWAEFDAANRRVGEAMTAYLRFVVPGRDGVCWCGAALAPGRVYCGEHSAAQGGR